MVPMTYAAELARKSIGKQLEKDFEDGHERMQYLERSLPDNVTIDMGLAMYELSQMPEFKSVDGDMILRNIEAGKVSKDFAASWRAYIDTFGCRTTTELDLGVPRMSETLDDLVAQIKGMSHVDDAYSPVSIYKSSTELREKTYQELISNLSGAKRKKIEKNYKTLVALGGKREALKYWFIRGLTAVRELLLVEADRLVEAGRLNHRDDVFALHLEELVRGIQSDIDLKEIVSYNQEFYKHLSQVKAFPKFIDSRGKILTLPPVEAKEGEVGGQPISPGVVTGRVKVLNTPDEKPLLAGEIMVTRATDPGWTPLFINAAAIVLEVGGLLQHGALVAREYGKPCVAGVEDAMNVLQDGQLVTVDATRGIITLLEEIEE